MAIDLSELTTDRDFCMTFQIERQEPPVWKHGRMTTKNVTLTVTGIVLPASSRDLELLDTADRVNGMKTFITNEEELRVSNTETLSDICIFKGQRYKLIQAFDYSANGFWKGIGTLLGEDDIQNDP